MDDLDQREAFLLAIFASPDDDLPRLVFADWLEERGEVEFAARIRFECATPATGGPTVRGFVADPLIPCTVELLADPHQFRLIAQTARPHWYGCTELKVSHGRIASSKPITTILTSPVSQRVTKLDLSGAEVVGDGTSDEVAGEYKLLDFEIHPAVTFLAVEALVNARECRRITHLDLRNNDLDNDAARAILRSNYLTRLESLHLFDGNQLRGRTWAALQAKFGEGVVS
jgi:uncharacterized protein (TIGR02996 family)